MRVIIVGCGKVGITLTQQLSLEGHDITVIDKNSNVVYNASNLYDVMGVVGNGASYGVQMDAGIEDADMLMAVTDSDELNLLCCLIAKKAGNCSTIARVRSPIYNNEIGFIREELGLSMTINPEHAAATEISRILRFPSAMKIDTFAKGKVEILKYQIETDSVLNSISLIELTKTYKSEILVCAVERDDDVIIPKGKFVLQEHDIINIVASPVNVAMFFDEIGVKINQVQDTMIVGGGTIAYYLAEQLLEMGINVKIIEKDLKRCQELSELLPKASIINGDATNEDVLLEEGIEYVESFVSLTGIDEANIFLSLFAKSKTKGKVVTKVNRISFDGIINSFNLGSIIYPKFITAENITQYIRAAQNSIGSNVETLINILENKAEALEFYVREDSTVVGTPLEELMIKDGIIVACINHKGTVITPRGKDIISVGDTVIIVTTNTGLRDIRDILRN